MKTNEGYLKEIVKGIIALLAVVLLTYSCNECYKRTESLKQDIDNETRIVKVS